MTWILDLAIPIPWTPPGAAGGSTILRKSGFEGHCGDAEDPEGLQRLRAAAGGERVAATRHQARQGVRRGPTMLTVS